MAGHLPGGSAGEESALVSVYRKLELPLRLGLFSSHAPDCNFRLVVTLALDRFSSDAAQYVDLADVSQRVGNWTL